MIKKIAPILLLTLLLCGCENAQKQSSFSPPLTCAIAILENQGVAASADPQDEPGMNEFFKKIFA